MKHMKHIEIESMIRKILKDRDITTFDMLQMSLLTNRNILLFMADLLGNEFDKMFLQPHLEWMGKNLPFSSLSCFKECLEIIQEIDQKIGEKND